MKREWRVRLVYYFKSSWRFWQDAGKAAFLSGSEHPDFAVSLVSTLLGDNGAFGRVGALA